MGQIEFPKKNETLKNITNHFHESVDRCLRSRTPTSTIDSKSVRRVLYQDEINQDKIGALVESLKAVEISYPIEYFPDLLQIHEFLNVHLDFLMLRTTFTQGVTMEYLESAIIDRHDADLYQLMYIFLAIVFKYRSAEFVGLNFLTQRRTAIGSFTRSTTRRLYSCNVYDLSCDEFTISEVLKLHLLVSSTPLLDRTVDSGTHDCYNAYRKLSDEFIKENGSIIQALHYDTIYRLSSSDLLKIFNCLLNQILTFDVVRKQIEVHLEPPSNYLGRDESGCMYWRFYSMAGIYIECNNNLWKCIDTRKIFDELLGMMNESPLKQNLEQHGYKTFEKGRSSTRQWKHFLKKYRFRNFYSFDDWPIIWEEKLSGFETLIQNLGLVCNNIKIDYDFFQKSFSEWEIPSNMAIIKSMKLIRMESIDQKLCQLYNLPKKGFSEEHLNVIRGEASKVAFSYYKLDSNRLSGSEQGALTMSQTIFEMFLNVQSVGELFLSFYQLYEELLESYGGCDICHSYELGAKSCNTCYRTVHWNCFARVPMALQCLSIKCHICQFRLEETEIIDLTVD